MAKHLELGQFGESLAVEHLKRLGYKILNRDFRTRFGQIDIIARDGEYIVFVEVKTRVMGGLGLPEDAITVKKKRKLVSMAYSYLIKYKLKDQRCRFDVLSIVIKEERTPQELRLIKDAFQEE